VELVLVVVLEEVDQLDIVILVVVVELEQHL
jgi:hypothetical protein